MHWLVEISKKLKSIIEHKNDNYIARNTRNM